jgi:hypothetical protein
MTTTSTSPTLAALDAQPGASRIRVAAGALAASAATGAVLLVTKPWGERVDTSADGFLSYDTMLRVRDAAWWGMLADGFALAVIGLSLSLCVLHLTGGRGRIAGLVGAVATMAGGVLFAMGATAFATFVWYATAPGLPGGEGRALLDYANDHAAHLVGVHMAGFAAYTLGTVVLVAALIRARSLPLVAPIAFLLLTAAVFVMPGASLALDILQIAQLVMLVAFAIVVWRRA